MALKMAGRNPVKFEWTDDVAETTVTIQPDDPSEVLRAKLQRVLDLEEDALERLGRLEAEVLDLPVRRPGAALQAAREDFPPLFDAAAAEAAVMAQSAMGWNEGTDLDALPEA